jgi:NADH dehydrogenase [ubiquinone] 1 alpha subcomplex assembly factor 6
MASVASLSRDPKIGLMRFKFWKDRIDSIYKQPDLKLTGEPITSELVISIKKHNLSKSWFNRLIEARETQLSAKKTYQTVKDVEQHGEYTVSPIYYLLLECLKIKNVNCDHAASHLGKSHMIANLVRSIPNQSRASISLIPLELLVKHKISQNEIIRLTNPERQEKKIVNENLKDLVYDLCNLSNQHLMKARKLNKQIPSNVNNLFLNSVVIETFLKNIEKYNFDINNPVLHKRDSFLPIKLFLGKLRKRY